jgi:hypothetical protein
VLTGAGLRRFAVQLPDRSYRRWGRDLDELQTIEDVQVELGRERVRDQRWKRHQSQVYTFVGVLAAAGLLHPLGYSWPF